MKTKGLVFLIIFFSAVITVADTLPLFENFDDGDYDGWEVLDIAPYSSGPSDWVVISGVLTQTTNIFTTEDEYDVYTGTRIITGDTSWTDYSFNVELKSTDDDGVGMLFRYRDAGNYYRYLRVEDDYNLGPFRRIEKCVDGVFTILAEDTSDFTYPANFFCITVWVSGNRMTILEEGIELLSAIDTDSTHSSGKIGLMCYANDGSYFDNVAILPEFHVDSSAAKILTGPYLQNPEDFSITIMWETTTDIDGMVYWGLTTVFTDSAVSPSGTFHEVRIEELSPETKYYYGVRVEDSLYAGLDFYFHTKIFDDTPYRMGIWGDNRTDYVTHERVVEALITKEPDMVVNVGDVVTSGTVYDQWNREYFWPARNLLRNKASYISIGNHEADADWFDTYVCQPGNEHWFAVRYGPAYLVFIDTNRWYYPYISEQWFWLDDVLSSTEAQSAPWLLVFHHHPPYSEGWDSPGYDGEPNVRDYLVPMYEDYDVDIVFAGHTHDYERGAKDGVAHVITGGGGAALDHWLQDWEWIWVYYACYHYIILDIASEYIVYRAYDWDNSIIDSTLFGVYVGVEEEIDLPEKPLELEIIGSSPNPFNASTIIDFSTNASAEVLITIHDINGRWVAKLAETTVGPGRHHAVWDTKRYEHRGDPVPSGIYLARIRAGDIEKTIRLTLIK